MSKTITYDSQGNDITCMKEFDALKYPCKKCNKTDSKKKSEELRKQVQELDEQIDWLYQLAEYKDVKEK